MSKPPVIVPIPMPERRPEALPQPGALVRNKSSVEQFFDLRVAPIKGRTIGSIAETAHQQLGRLYAIGDELNPTGRPDHDAELAELRSQFISGIGYTVRSVTSETKLKAN